MPALSPRQQLAVYSPLPGTAVARAFLDGASVRAGAADHLTALLRARYEADAVVLVDSGTSALRIAIRLAARASGRAAPVALPAFTCFEVASAAVGAGADIVLYDIDPGTLAPDHDSLEQALRAGARTVVVSPLFGVPVDWDTIASQVSAHGAIAIEDAAQGHGASWDGRPLGSLGELSVLSFGRGKGWTGSGGGALLMRGSAWPSHPLDDLMDTTARAAVGRRAAMAFAQWGLGRPSLYGLPSAIPPLGLGRTVYHPPRPPRAIDGFTAALLVATHDIALREGDVRRETARRWESALHSRAGRIAVPARGRAGHLRYAVRVGDGAIIASRDDARRLGIAPTYPATLDTLPAVRARMRRDSGSFTGAETLTHELMTLPTHSLLTPSDADAIVSLLEATSGGACAR